MKGNDASNNHCNKLMFVSVFVSLRKARSARAALSVAAGRGFISSMFHLAVNTKPEEWNHIIDSE